MTPEEREELEVNVDLYFYLKEELAMIDELRKYIKETMIKNRLEIFQTEESKVSFRKVKVWDYEEMRKDPELVDEFLIEKDYMYVTKKPKEREKRKPRKKK